ncbi:MAG TPA: adenosylcobinamide-phosphate synthase, partial [bacterium (Candidatus Stahlbacteria)]|nr:adenosylcobinamide-phosphate synthase [Candidatus Stahlbacteria bacterium]
LYKVINTGDSMFGYKNEKYMKFGWASAKLDDLANFIPARLTGLLVPVASFLLGLNAKKSLKILIRDRKKHASPNSGHSEAAVAGALGIQLGGTSRYFGKTVTKPTLGDADKPISHHHIWQAIRIMLLTSALAMLLFLAIRLLLGMIGF